MTIGEAIEAEEKNVRKSNCNCKLSCLMHDSLASPDILMCLGILVVSLFIWA